MNITTREIVTMLTGVMNRVDDGDKDGAIAMLWRIKRALEDEPQHLKHPIRLEREPAFQDDLPGDLPPMIPLRNKPKNTIDFVCPTCHAKPGRPCVKVSTRGKGNEPLGTQLVAGKRHAARRKAWNVYRGQA
jgi:hypothetical protein